MNERNFHVRDLIANRDGNGGDQRTLPLGRPVHAAANRLRVTLEPLQEGSESECAKKAEQLTPARATAGAKQQGRRIEASRLCPLAAGHPPV